MNEKQQGDIIRTSNNNPYLRFARILISRPVKTRITVLHAFLGLRNWPPFIVRGRRRDAERRKSARESERWRMLLHNVHSRSRCRCCCGCCCQSLCARLRNKAKRVSGRTTLYTGTHHPSTLIHAHTESMLGETEITLSSVCFLVKKRLPLFYRTFGSPTLRVQQIFCSQENCHFFKKNHHFGFGSSSMEVVFKSHIQKQIRGYDVAVRENRWSSVTQYVLLPMSLNATLSTHTFAHF